MLNQQCNMLWIIKCIQTCSIANVLYDLVQMKVQCLGS
jgi:hypothetical protein